MPGPGVPRDAARPPDELRRRRRPRRPRRSPSRRGPAGDPARDRAGRRAPAHGGAPDVPRRLAAPLVAAPRGSSRDVRRRGRGAVLPERHGARRAAARASAALQSRSRRCALAQSDVVFVLGTPFDFRVDYGRRRRGTTARRSCRSISTAPSSAETARVDVAIHGDSGLVLEQLAARGRREDRRPSGSRTMRADEDKRRAKMAAEIESSDSPPNPLRVCAELGKRLGPNDIVIGDGGDFVATAAYVLKLEWPQLWMDPGPLGTLGVGPGYAMAAKLAAPRRATSCSSTATAASVSTALEFEAMARQNIPVIARHRQRRRLDADPPRPGRALRRGARRRDGARLHALREGRRGRAAVAASGSRRVEELGPALDAAFACEKPACVNVKIAQERLPQGRDQRLSVLSSSGLGAVGRRGSPHAQWPMATDAAGAQPAAGHRPSARFGGFRTPLAGDAAPLLLRRSGA